MKRKLSLKRTAAAALTAVMGLACLWPGLTAKAVDISIDDSAFRDPTITKMTIYHWIEGIPGYSWSQTFGKKFPVLMTWDDQYYFKIKQSVADQMDYHVSGDGEDSLLNGQSGNKKDSGYVNGSFEADGQYPHGYYLQNSGYPGTLLSELDAVNFPLLSQNGSLYSLSIPECIPNLIVCWPGNTNSALTPDGNYNRMHANTRYAIEVDLPQTYAWYSADYVGDYYTDGGLRQGENYLVGVRRDYCEHWITPGDISTLWIDVHNQANGFYWSLYALNKTVATEWVKQDKWFTEVKSTYSDFADGGVEHAYNTYPFVDYFCWYGAERTANGKKYACFWTLGSWIHGKPFYLCDEMGDYDECKDLTSRYPKISLGHWLGNFETRGNFNGNDVLDTFKGSRNNLHGANQDEFSFRCFYAKPETIDCLSTDFTVENGQVSNLDGPIAITNNATITVKDGGTLSIDGWVMNNGKIVVEEGGTLYLQDGACLARFNEGTSYGGGIISRGLVIVGEDAKLVGGGADGLQLLNGSHVVNYGCVASENFKVVNSHTIENRDKGFVLHGSGNGVTNFGSVTYQTPLSYSTDSSGHYTGSFAERGKVLDTCSDNVSSVPNAIYWE